ncbi:hypothetical protein [Streptomyces sp. CdTB01]|uniref:hypothetical protein n=1 Tax=Streptomyces sp. CdTB01 TaxID=1725411 RepID=UPI00131F4688|nr:hypothetical protein [Streptomyces sp. CdTB01]
MRTRPEPRRRADKRAEASGERAVVIEGNNYAPVLTGDHSRALSFPWRRWLH